MKLIFPLFILALVSLPASAQVSYVQMGKTLHKGGYELIGTGRSWSSLSRYDEDGKETKYEGSQGFSYFEGEFQGKFGATDELQFNLGVNFRQNQAEIESPSNADETTSVSSSGVQAITGGFQYSFKPVERLHYSLLGFGRFMTYGNSTYDASTDDPTKNLVLGDEGPDYGAGLVVTYAHPKDRFLTVRGLYRRPGKELSPELDWLVEGALSWRYFALVLGVEGVQSLNQDAYTKDPENKPQFNTGGTALYNSINRQYIAPYAGFNIGLGLTWRIEVRYQQVLNARSYDTGSLISVSLGRRVDSNPTAMIDKKFKEYDIEASITKVSPKKQYVIIDKGLSSDVTKGQRFDIFHTDYLGGNVLLGTGVITQVNADQAVMKITGRFSTKFQIKEGTTVRGVRR